MKAETHLASKSLDIAPSHQLEGFLYRYYPEKVTSKNKVQLKKAWKLNWARNNQYIQKIKQLDDCLIEEEIEVIALKGLVLINDVYRDMGSRFMSDVDLMIDPNLIKKLRKILTDLGYEKLAENKWKANGFKETWTTPLFDSHFTLELHTCLFFHEPKGFRWKVRNLPGFSNVKKLDDEEMLVHLVGHLAFQHTFLKLFWFFDIDLYLRDHIEKLNWEKIFKLAKQLELFQSHRMTLWALRKYCQTPLSPQAEKFFRLNKLAWFKLFLRPGFLLRNKQMTFSHYVIKHLSKDRFSTALKYDILWLSNKIKTIFSKNRS